MMAARGTAPSNPSTLRSQYAKLVVAMESSIKKPAEGGPGGGENL
jgi:hypothetical protein